MINIIIFSKNRAAQLDLFIRSVKRFFKGWQLYDFSVLYTCSDEEYYKGYEKVFVRHPEFSYVREEAFKFDLLFLIRDENPYTVFFVDDNVFKSEFDIHCDEFISFAKRNDVLSFTLRLGLNTTWCYTQKRDSLPPEFLFDSQKVWEWRKATGPEWNYPMSVDGGFFHTKDIKPLAQLLEYQNPNTFEGTLANHPIDKPYMVCPPKSIILNVPANKVQTANGNLCGNIPADYLNSKFLEGYQLPINNLVNYNNRAPHEEIDYILEGM